MKPVRGIQPRSNATPSTVATPIIVKPLLMKLDRKRAGSAAEPGSVIVEMTSGISETTAATTSSTFTPKT